MGKLSTTLLETARRLWRRVFSYKKTENLSEPARTTPVRAGLKDLLVGEQINCVDNTVQQMVLKSIRNSNWWAIPTLLLLDLTSGVSVLALPPPEETPEEVLRTEIITEARSPIDGKPLTAAEYAELQAQLQAQRGEPQLAPKVRETIFLLRLRRAIRTILPFLPI